jgi:predicted glycosyltransferase involved in capsule biosynthesis
MISNKIEPYKNLPEAWIISCYFNSNNYVSRRRNFDVFYQQLRRSNVNYLIAECAFGDEKFDLPNDERILRFRSKNKLWQKERLLNLVIKQLPPNCKYVFWLDADVLLTNKNWIVEAVEVLKTHTICQPFSLAVRLEKDEIEPNFNVQGSKLLVDFPNSNAPQQTRLWRSFAYNYKNNKRLTESLMFDIHGHTGFAWGARREILDQIPLYDKAIVGTADHIIAHAAVAQIPHNCLEKAFTDRQELDNIYDWSRRFNQLTQNKLGFIESELWHLWHGELQNRQYLQRTQQFSKVRFNPHKDLVKNKDGLYEIPEERKDVQNWMNDYFESRREDERSYSNETTYTSPETISSSVETTRISETPETFEGFGGGGDFAGGGAGGSWENYS